MDYIAVESQGRPQSGKRYLTNIFASLWGWLTLDVWFCCWHKAAGNLKKNNNPSLSLRSVTSTSVFMQFPSGYWSRHRTLNMNSGETWGLYPVNAFRNCLVCARFLKNFYETIHIFKPMQWSKYLYGSAFSFIYNCWKQYHHQSQETGILSFVCEYNLYRNWKKLLLVWVLVTPLTNTHT